MIKQKGCRYKFMPNKGRRKYIGGFTVCDFGNRNEIWSLSILEEYRNKGHGTQMLKEFLQQYTDEKPLFLYVLRENDIAIHMYEKLGFKIVGEHYSYAWTMQYMPC